LSPTINIQKKKEKERKERTEKKEIQKLEILHSKSSSRATANFEVIVKHAPHKTLASKCFGSKSINSWLWCGGRPLPHNRHFI